MRCFFFALRQTKSELINASLQNYNHCYVFITLADDNISRSSGLTSKNISALRKADVNIFSVILFIMYYFILLTLCDLMKM